MSSLVRHGDNCGSASCPHCHAHTQYLGDGVEREGSLGSVEVGVEDAAGQLAGDQDRLHGLPHGLLGPQGQLEAALGAALSERDVVLDVDRDGHQTEGRTSTFSEHRLPIMHL